MNNFATKKEKPTASEYLSATLDDVLERLNNNPSGQRSEETLVLAVITVRAAKINECLSKRLNNLTCVIAVATVLLVVVPFIVPSVEKKQIEAKLSVQSEQIESQRQRIEQLVHSMSQLAQKHDALAGELEKHNRALRPSAQPQMRPGGG